MTIHFVVTLDPTLMAAVQAIAAGLNPTDQLDRIERTLKNMSDETRKLFADMDAATNAVAARLQKLADATDDADVKEGLSAEISRLTAMGADPNAPALTTT